MISEKHRTVFVHIPKVAGQSIETVFLRDLGLDWDSRSQLLLRKKRPGEHGPHRLAHLTAGQYVDLGYMDPADFDTFFTFSFVRNPYKRLLSVYNYLGYNRVVSFKAFMNKVVRKQLRLRDFFYASQYHYLYEGERLLVDYVGKMERLETDMQFVLEKAGLKGRSIPHINKSGKGLKRGLAALIKNPALWPNFSPGHLFNGSVKKELNQEEKDLVYELYQKDFEKFGYER